jgi:6-phosphogluconate dehydrogenase
MSEIRTVRPRNMADSAPAPQLGLYGLAVMGQNLALNIASKGFPIAVCNRSKEKVRASPSHCQRGFPPTSSWVQIATTVERAKAEGDVPVIGIEDPAEFVRALPKPRTVILLVQAGPPVDATIELLSAHMEEGDLIVDGGNEWFPNSVRRSEELAKKGIQFMGMGVSGGEEGARFGPSLMPGGPRDAYDRLEPILSQVAAKTDSGPCVTYVGEIGSGNHVKMVHNGIEYGDMQLIAEAYDVLRTVGGLSNEELAATFEEWNRGELESFLVEITGHIFRAKDDRGDDKSAHLVDKVLDKTGMKGTGKWTVQEAAERSVPAGTISAALEARYLSGLKEERLEAEKMLTGPTDLPSVDREQLVEDVRRALYAAKVCAYAQGMNIIREAARQNKWSVNLGECARIWKGGCIIRAKFLDRIKAAYDRNPDLANLLVDPEFAAEVNIRQQSWRRVVTLAAACGVACPAMSASLAYLDQYRRGRLPANLVQAQRDYFGAHKYERVDGLGTFVHSEWARLGSKPTEAAKPAAVPSAAATTTQAAAPAPEADDSL